MAEPAGTSIATSTPTSIVVRGHDLAEELIGKVDFTSVVFLQSTGRMPSDGERAVLDACMVAIMEHGLTPSAVSARLTNLGAPEALQGAVAAGLLGAGNAFLGTMEGSARLLQRGVEQVRAGATTEEEYCAGVVDEHTTARKPLPGFGHRVHKPDDPRSARLIAVGRDAGVAAEHTALLERMSALLDAARGSHVTINATGAIAALLSDIGLPWDVLRGYALIARCAGLVGHLLEEKQRPLAGHIVRLLDREIPYDGDLPTSAECSRPGGALRK